jgi:hypothetical protein
MGAGVATAAIGGLGSLVQGGIGLYQQHQAKLAGDQAFENAKNMPKQANAFDNATISNQAYASQEQQNAQQQANLIQALGEQGATGALGGVGLVQQQGEQVNANIASAKAQELQQLEMQKKAEQQRIDDEYLQYQKQLGLMEIQGAGLAQSQGNSQLMAGLGGLASVGAMAAGNKNFGKKIVK